MRIRFIITVLILTGAQAFGQNAQEIIASVFKAQKSLNTISYTLVRTDTLVTGDVRTMSGSTQIMVDKADTVFGFKFWSKKDKDKLERIYDGHLGYEVNPESKTYTVTARPFDYFLVNGGGQIVLIDLVRLDTSKVVSLEVNQDQGFYFLKMNYADLKQYDVIKRYKTLTINKKTMLPVAMRRHQETLGKVQDLYYQVQEIAVNDPAFHYDFSSFSFLKGLNQHIIARTNSPVMVLKDKAAPAFNLMSFNNIPFNLSELKGKAVLLDFWEVWCGPCLESMPKIQRLYYTYKSKGLQVYGITCETKQLAPAKLLVSKREITFPMLIGGEQLKKDYKIYGIPLYILIGKDGKIAFIKEGFSDEIESAVKAALL